MNDNDVKPIAFKSFPLYDRVLARIGYLEAKSVLTLAERKELEASDKMFRISNYFKRQARAKKRVATLKNEIMVNFFAELEKAVFPMTGFDSLRTDAHRGTFHLDDFQTMGKWLIERLKTVDFLSNVPRSIWLETKDGVRIFDLNLEKLSDSRREISNADNLRFGDSICKMNFHKSTHNNENWSVGCK